MNRRFSPVDDQPGTFLVHGGDEHAAHGPAGRSRRSSCCGCTSATSTATPTQQRRALSEAPHDQRQVAGAHRASASRTASIVLVQRARAREPRLQRARGRRSTRSTSRSRSRSPTLAELSKAASSSDRKGRPDHGHLQPPRAAHQVEPERPHQQVRRPGEDAEPGRPRHEQPARRGEEAGRCLRSPTRSASPSSSSRRWRTPPSGSAAR